MRRTNPECPDLDPRHRLEAAGFLFREEPDDEEDDDNGKQDDDDDDDDDDDAHDDGYSE